MAKKLVNTLVKLGRGTILPEAVLSFMGAYIEEIGATYIKFSNGMIIQWVYINFKNYLNIHWGGSSTLHYNNSGSANWPIPFKGIPYTWQSFDLTSGVTVTSISINRRPTATNTGTFYVARNGNASTTYTVGYIYCLGIGFYR